MKQVLLAIFGLTLASAAYGAEYPPPRYEPSYQRELNWGPDRRGPRYDSSWYCELKWGPRICARRRQQEDRR